MDTSVFQKRIGYKGDLEVFLQKVIDDYKLGSIKSSKPILQGYEDFNVKIETDGGKYLVKMMGASRSDDEAKQYVDIIQKAVDSGVSHPKLYLSSQGNLYKTRLGGIEIRLVVMDFIEGADFYKLAKKPTKKEARFLVNQASKISLIDIRPKYVYDSWAIPNFLREYNAIKNQLAKEDLKYIEPLATIFPGLGIDELPHCFVHGDIIATNVIRANDGQLYIIDFAVANWYPRIQELAVLLCDLLFVNNKDKYLENYHLALDTYQRTVKLDKKEIELLPIYIKLAHAMHIVPATREKIKGNALPENDFWLKSGQDGIRIVNKIWS